MKENTYSFFMFALISFLLLLLAFSIAEQSKYEKYSKKCDGILLKAKYVPSGKSRIRRNVILEDDTLMPYAEWQKCEFVLKKDQE